MKKGPFPEQNQNITNELDSLDESTTPKPKFLSYNDTIKDYDLSLLTPNKITINHLLTISPISADISDAFGHIIFHPETALSCQIFLFKSTEDSLPTLDLSKAEMDEN